MQFNRKARKGTLRFQDGRGAMPARAIRNNSVLGRARRARPAVTRGPGRFFGVKVNPSSRRPRVMRWFSMDPPPRGPLPVIFPPRRSGSIRHPRCLRCPRGLVRQEETLSSTSPCGREGAGLRQGHEVRPVHVVREEPLAAEPPHPDVTEDAGGIEERAARRDGRTLSQLVILGNPSTQYGNSMGYSHALCPATISSRTVWT